MKLARQRKANYVQSLLDMESKKVKTSKAENSTVVDRSWEGKMGWKKCGDISQRVPNGSYKMNDF